MSRPALLVASVAMLVGTTSPSGAYPRPGTTERVSITFLGTEGLGTEHASQSSISDSGRLVAFESNDPTLVAVDDKIAADVFAFDRATGSVELMTVSSSGLPAVGPNPLTSATQSLEPSISGDGRYVAFTSDAPNLVDGDTNNIRDVFVHDRTDGTTERVSVSTDGQQGNGEIGSSDPNISRSGRYVVFTSASSNLVERDGNLTYDVFLHDRKDHSTQRVSVSLGDGDADPNLLGGRSSMCGSVSDDGRFVVFKSVGTRFVDEDPLLTVEAYVRDIESGKTEVVSVDSAGSYGRGVPSGGAESCGDSSISGDGRYVVFSHSMQLVPNDPFGPDLYMHDRQTHRTTRLTVDSFGRGGEGAGTLWGMSVSRNGRFVSFSIWDDDLTEGDTSQCEPIAGVPIGVPIDCAGDQDVFVHDVFTGATELVSADNTGTEADPCAASGLSEQSNNPSVNANGRFLAFASCSSSLVADDNNAMWDVFVRDRGVPLGVDAIVDSDHEQGSGTECTEGVCLPSTCIGGTCIPPGAALSSKDGIAAGVLDGADLIEVRFVNRSEYEDIFVTLELDHMPNINFTDPGMLNGLRFAVGEKDYEVRATSLDGGRFGLFDCTVSFTCRKLADLLGGFGTTGMRVVFSLPLAEIGLRDGGELSHVTAFSAIGSYLGGGSKILDSVHIK